MKGGKPLKLKTLEKTQPSQLPEEILLLPDSTLAAVSCYPGHSPAVRHLVHFEDGLSRPELSMACNY